MPAPVIPFKRPLYPTSHVAGPTTGEDVIAVKIAISRAGFWPWQEFDQVYNDAFAHGTGKNKGISGVHGFKVQQSITIQGDTYDKWTHEALLKTRVPKGKPHEGEGVWNAYARALYRGFEDTTEAERIVQEFFRQWDILVANEPRSHYSQQRPIIPLSKRQDPIVFPNWLDCSGTVIYCAWLADAKSPDPYGYSGYGNTNSLNDNGRRITEGEIDKYAKDHIVLAFYGPSRWYTTHVIALKSRTRGYSMGREGGPETVNGAGYRRDLVEIRAYEVV